MSFNLNVRHVNHVFHRLFTCPCIDEISVEIYGIILQIAFVFCAARTIITDELFILAILSLIGATMFFVSKRDTVEGAIEHERQEKRKGLKVQSSEHPEDEIEKRKVLCFENAKRTD